MTHSTPSPAIENRMGLHAWGLLIALSILWGGSFFFVEVALTSLPPLTLVTLRVGFAAVALWLFIVARSTPIPTDRTVWIAFFGMGLLNNVLPYSLITWGQTEISSGLAAILNACTPLFTVLVAGAALSDEPLSRRKLLGVLLGVGGVTVMVGPDALRGLGLAVFAQLAVLGAALSYACAGVFGRRFKRLGVDPMVTAAGQVTASTILLLPVTLAVDSPWHALAVMPATTWAALLALAVLSTALAYVLYFRILASSGATNLLLVTFFIPVTAILLGIVFLGEQLAWRHCAGMALIGLGLSAIDGRLWIRSQSQKTVKTTG